MKPLSSSFHLPAAQSFRCHEYLKIKGIVHKVSLDFPILDPEMCINTTKSGVILEHVIDLIQHVELVPSRPCGYNNSMTSLVGMADDEKIAGLFGQLSQPARIQILLVIREQPACVCHLVAALGLRQAAISQHLMALRDAGWVSTSRNSRFVYYHLAEKRLLPLIESAAQIAEISFTEIARISRRPLETCPCPQCHPELPPEFSCKSISNP